MDPILLGIIAILILLGLMATGMPVAFVLAFAGALFFFFFLGFEPAMAILGTVPYSTLTELAITTVPLFILMAELLACSGFAGDLFDAAHKWLGRVPGGLAVSSIGASAVFGAVCGTSISGAATIGVVAIPEMMDRGYDKRLSTGSVAAGGALSSLIPPSLPIILYGIITENSIAKLFMAGLIPGLLLAVIFMIYIILATKRRPGIAPTSPSVPWRVRFGILTKAGPIVLLIAIVLGTIYLGICTPTESGAIGAFGALFIGIASRRLNWDSFKEALFKTTVLSAGLCMIVVGGMIFGYFLTVSRFPQEIAAFLVSLDVSKWVILAAINILLIGLGCILDVGSLIIIIVPIIYPVVMQLGFDPIWFGAMLMVNFELAVITPPVGLNLYVIKSIVPEVPLGDIIRGTMPFAFLDALGLVIIIIFPQLALWIPNMM